MREAENYRRDIVKKPVQERANEAFGRIMKGKPVCANQKGSCLGEFKGVTLHFGDKTIFDDLNLAIRSGECRVLLGPRAIGKATLLRLFLHPLRPAPPSISSARLPPTHL